MPNIYEVTLGDGSIWQVEAENSQKAFDFMRAEIKKQRIKVQSCDYPKQLTLTIIARNMTLAQFIDRHVNMPAFSIL